MNGGNRWLLVFALAANLARGLVEASEMDDQIAPILRQGMQPAQRT